MSDGQNGNRFDLTQWTEIEEVPDSGILAGVVGEDHVFVWRTGEIALRLIAQTAHTVCAAVVARGASALLKGARPKPMLVRLAFRTAFSLPQCVGAFAEAFMLRLVPEVVGAAIRPTRLLPKQVGALANDLV
jgi:hypothetical protein